jgi:hypothetical protein
MLKDSLLLTLNVEKDDFVFTVEFCKEKEPAASRIAAGRN